MKRIHEENRFMKSEGKGTDETKINISIIIAILNEEEYIRKCLDSLLNQNFPRDKYEIIIIDGMSQDKTREIITGYKTRFPRIIKIFDNPKKIQAAGRNIGIINSIGDIIIIFGGHSFADSGCLSALIRNLENASPDVAGVGANHFAPADETIFGKIMAEVQNTLVGGGSTSYRKTSKNRYVDTVAFVAYRKNILEKVGLYDERFVIGEDLEINWRIRRAGFKLMISPEAKVYYYHKHGSLKLLFIKMYKYGLWRAFTNKKHPSSFKVLFLLPVILVLSLISLPITLFFYPLLAEIILAGLAIYLAVVLISSLNLIVTHKDSKYLLSFPIYILEYIAMGTGFLTGLFRRISNSE